MKVLFVCTANTCRSPMAEEIFNKINDDSNIEAKSAGIVIVPGSFVTENSIELIKEELKTWNLETKEIKQVYKLASRFVME